MLLPYLNFNGRVIPSGEPVLLSDNRAFRFGDSLFETIRIAHGRVLFLNDHISRLTRGMQYLQMNVPDSFTDSAFGDMIIDLAHRNQVTSDARIRLTVFRNTGGFYSPTNNEVSFLMEMETLDFSGFELNQKGYVIDVFSDIKKMQHPISSLKTGNALVYIMAGLYKLKHQLDDCILLNDKGNIVESISSNVFAVKNGVLYTPPVTEGCLDGVMRKQIIRIAQENRIAVYEIDILQNVLLSADELFLTNAIQGIRWIMSYKAKRYFNSTAKSLCEKLNARISN